MDLVYEDAPEATHRENAEILFPLHRELAVTCPSPFIGTINTTTCTSIGCTAKDLSYLTCELVPVDASGAPLSTQCINCNCGDPIRVKVKCKIRNDTGSERKVAWVIGRLVQSGSCPSGPIDETCRVGFCNDEAILPKDEEVERTFPTVLTWVCGSTVKLTNVILGGAPTSSACAGYNKCQQFGPKCDKPAEFKISTPLGPPSPAVTCKGGATQNQIVSYKIVGGTGNATTPYLISISCSSTSATYNETKPAEGSYTKEIPNCAGTISVTVTDSEGCVRTGSTPAPVCCFNKFNCTALAALGPFNECDASKVYIPNRTFAEVFVTNTEACSGTPSFSSSTVYTPNPTAVCSGVNVTRTFTAVPKDSAGNPDTANTKTCLESWIVKSLDLPTIVAGPATTLACGATNNPGNRTNETTPTAQCGTASVTQKTKSVVTNPTNCAAVKTVTLSFTATDQCGRNATADRVFTYEDKTPPKFTGTCAAPLPDVPLSCSSTTIPTTTCTATDECSIATVTPTCCSDGTHLTRTWTARDTCGNVATPVTQNVTFGVGTC